MQAGKKCLSVALLLMAHGALAECDSQGAVVATYWPRSQARDRVRQVVGVEDKSNLDKEGIWGFVTAMPGFTKTFKADALARSLFGPALSSECGSDCRSVKIQGSLVKHRDQHALFADTLYLRPDYNGGFTIDPSIKNQFIDFDMYMGFDTWCGNWYARLFVPVVRSEWNLDFKEFGSEGTAGHTEGYFSVNELPANQLLDSARSYFAGKAPNDGLITQTAEKYTIQQQFPLVFNPLRYARIDCGSTKKTRIADMRGELGWNFIQHECGHLGANIQVSAPTGNARDAEYFFDALVGNGKHWEIAAGVQGQRTVWENQSASRSVTVYGDATLSHIFAANEQRTFDLVGKPLSRYMLAAKMSAPIEDGLTIGGVAPSGQFKGEYMPVANLTTIDVRVSAGIQADILGMITYKSCAWSWDIGYNFWIRGCETIERPNSCFECTQPDCDTPSLCDPSQERLWVLKGDARVYGFVNAGSTADGNANNPVALSFSEQEATVFNGTNSSAINLFGGDNGLPPTPNPAAQIYNRNLGVDNPREARTQPNPLAIVQPLAYARGLMAQPSDRINGSLDPVYLSCSDINFCQRTRGLSHKLFTHVNYTWERSCWVPFVGVGGFAEFGKTTNDCCGSSTTDCLRASLSQWGLWLKAGISFK